MMVERLLKWIEANSKSLNLQLKHLQGSSELFPELVDISCHITFNGQVHEGRGSSVNKNLAVIKALMEAVERTVVSECALPSTNGVAAGFNLETTRTRAFLELIERDNFLIYHHGLVEPESVNNYQSLVSESVYNSIQKIINLGYGVRFLGLSLFQEASVFLCIISGNTFGNIIGLGNDYKKVDSAEKAFIEAYLNFINYYKNSHSPRYQNLREYDLDWLLSADMPLHEKHRYYALNPENTNSSVDAFWNRRDSIQLSSLNSLNRHFVELVIPQVFQELNLHVVRCSSDDLQGLYWGKAGENDINWKRIKNFGNLNLKNLNGMPHFLA